MRVFGYTLSTSQLNNQETRSVGVGSVVRRNSFGRISTYKRRSEWGILGFAAFSFLGTLSLSYYCLTGLEHRSTMISPEQAPVYDAKAAPAETSSVTAGEGATIRLPSAGPNKRLQPRRHHEESGNTILIKAKSQASALGENA